MHHSDARSVGMAVSKGDKPGFFARIKRPIRNMHQEMKRVQWPHRRDLMIYSAAVIGVSLVVAMFIFILDYVIGIVMGLILSIGA